MNRYLQSFLRYGAVIVASTLTAFLTKPSEAGVVALLMVFVSVKFLIFDGVVGFTKNRLSSFVTSPWYVVGYLLAAGYDVYLIYIAVGNEGNQGLAFLGTILLTPWMLAVAYVIMWIHTFVRKRQSQK